MALHPNTVSNRSTGVASSRCSLALSSLSALYPFPSPKASFIITCRGRGSSVTVVPTFFLRPCSSLHLSPLFLFPFLAVIFLLSPAAQDTGQALAQVSKLLEALQTLLQHPTFPLVLEAQSNCQFHHCLIIHICRKVEHGRYATSSPHRWQEGLQVTGYTTKLYPTGSKAQGSRLIQAGVSRGSGGW